MGAPRGALRAARPYRTGLGDDEAYRRTGDPLVLKAAVDLARYLLSRSRLGDVFITFERTPLRRPHGPGQLSAAEMSVVEDRPPGIFVDCLHFDPRFFAALGVISGDRQCVEESVRQALGYVYLLQADCGLFDHFALAGSPRTYGAGWGRGQGWALLGLLDLLEELPETTERLGEVAEAASQLAHEMIRLQREDGHWYAVVNDPTGVNGCWVAGDETYGASTDLRTELETRGVGYVLAVACDHHEAYS